MWKKWSINRCDTKRGVSKVWADVSCPGAEKCESNLQISNCSHIPLLDRQVCLEQMALVQCHWHLSSWSFVCLFSFYGTWCFRQATSNPTQRGWAFTTPGLLEQLGHGTVPCKVSSLGWTRPVATGWCRQGAQTPLPYNEVEVIPVESNSSALNAIPKPNGQSTCNSWKSC